MRPCLRLPWSLLVVPFLVLPPRAGAQSEPSAPAPDAAPPPPSTGRLVAGARIRVSFGEGAYRLRETGVLQALARDTLVYEVPPKVLRRVPRSSLAMIEVGRHTPPTTGRILGTATLTSAGAVALFGITDLLLSSLFKPGGRNVDAPDYGKVAVSGAAFGVVFALATGSTRWEPPAPDP